MNVDTLKITQELEAVGVERKQAEAHAKVIYLALDVSQDDLATKTDLRLLRTDIETGSAEMRADMETRLSEMRADMETRFSEMRADMETRLSELKADFYRALWINSGVVVTIIGVLLGIFRG